MSKRIWTVKCLTYNENDAKEARVFLGILMLQKGFSGVLSLDSEEEEEVPAEAQSDDKR